MLLAHSLNGMQLMLDICTNFGVEYDIIFNNSKSGIMRIGPRYNVVCAPLQLAGKCLQFVESIKYLDLRVHIVANRKFKCTFEEVIN